MKKTIILLTLIFTVMFSSPSYAEWTKVSESVDGTTFYVDFERIRKHGGYVYYWVLSDYLKPNEFGDLSAKVYKQGDCKLFRNKTLSENYFIEPMGGGTPKVWELTKFQKDWMYPSPNSVDEFVLKTVCAYAK